MNSSTSEKINFNLKRDGSAIILDGFKWIKQNFKTVTLFTLLIPGPFLMLAGGINGMLQQSGFDLSLFMDPAKSKEAISQLMELMPRLIPFVVFSMLGSLIYTAVINRYLILYTQAHHNSITLKNMIHFLPKDVWRLFYNYFFFSLLAIVLVTCIILLVMIPVLGALIFVSLLLLAGPNLYFALKNASFLILRDEVSIFYAIIRTFKKMKGNWWLTWFITIGSTIMVSIASLVFTLPQWVYNTMVAFSGFNPDISGAANHSTFWFVFFGIIAIVGQYTLFPIINILTVLTHHSNPETPEAEHLT